MPNVRSLSTNYNGPIVEPLYSAFILTRAVDQIRTGFNTDPARLGDLDY